jgi:hypothetical protein
VLKIADEEPGGGSWGGIAVKDGPFPGILRDFPVFTVFSCPSPREGQHIAHEVPLSGEERTGGKNLRLVLPSVGRICNPSISRTDCKSVLPSSAVGDDAELGAGPFLGF